MSNYTINVDWDGKDALADSNAAKVISGDDFQTEFETVQTAVNSKANLNGSSSEDFAINNGTVAGTFAITGVPTAPTQSAGNNTTRIATTAFVTTAVSNATVTAAEVNALAYPIGSIYTAIVSTNPNTLLGVGTWSAFGSGKVLVGLDSGDGDFNSSEETGGAKTVGSGTSGSTTLSTSQMPAHTHTLNAYTGTGGGSGFSTGGGTSGYHTTSSTGSGGGHTHTTPSHSLVQPYIVVYFWKRTA